LSQKHLNIDLEGIEGLTAQDLPATIFSNHLETSVDSISKIVKATKEKSNILSQYRTLRNLHLTELQLAILSKITPFKLEEAKISELISAYKTLRASEVEEISPTESIQGLVAHLLHLERLEKSLGRKVDSSDIEDAEYEENTENLPAVMENQHG
jgi:hypothetical protein